MKRKPKLTKPLKHDFQVVEVFNSKHTILEASHKSKRTINSLCKSTAMCKSTFLAALERTKNKGYLTYQTHGRGKRATDFQVTESGVFFLNEMMRHHPSLRRVSSSEKFMDLDKQNRVRIVPAAVMKLDIEKNGAIERWRCPRHPKSKIDYLPVKGRGAITICQEPGCNQKKYWYSNIELPKDFDVSSLPVYK